MEASRRLERDTFWRVEERTRKSEKKVPKAAGTRDCFERVKKISWNQALLADDSFVEADQARQF